MYTDIIFIFSRACAIEFQDRVVVTGGWDGNYIIATVQVYTLSGAQEQLPSLQTPRYEHACAHYMDSQDRAVSIACNIRAHLTIQGGPKKSGISKTMAITPLKSIRKGKSWCVSENSA